MLTLVLGGVRSGKSRHAQALCAGREVLFVATARDDGEPEWHARIARHRRERPAHWTTAEEPLDVPGVVRTGLTGATVLVDCITVWLANLMWERHDDSPEERSSYVLRQMDALAATAGARDVVVVSNEVGYGVVPASVSGREFRDVQGLANQRLAAAAGHVVLVVAGIPWTLKEGLR